MKCLAHWHPAPLQIEEIHSLLDHLGLTITDEELRSHLYYLKEKNLLLIEYREAGGIRIEMVRISADGLDVLDKFSKDIGVNVEF